MHLANASFGPDRTLGRSIVKTVPRRAPSSLRNPYRNVEPGLVLLNLLELRARTEVNLILDCGLGDVPRRLRPHATPLGPDRVSIPRLAALRWVEPIAESMRGAHIPNI